MAATDRRYEDFRTGDSVSFTRRWERGDFEAFAALSGDRNPLHHDPAYAAQAEFGQVIVPLHLAAAPLSAIAGMMLPGHRALYLGGTVRAVRAIPYGQDVTYSARIVAKQDAARVLHIRVVAFQHHTVLLDGEMRVRVRDDVAVGTWRDDDRVEVHHEGDTRLALVTGAAGGVGSALSLLLARRGWRLILHHRGDPARAAQLRAACAGSGAAVDVVRGPLDSPQGRRNVLAALAGLPEVTALLHVASPRIDAGWEALMSVNYVGLRELAEAVLPGMLRRQEGRILLLGSSAVQHHPAGWDHYVAAKTAATEYVRMLHQRYAPYGITGVTVAPGYIRTPFSHAHRPPHDPGLLPEEVAEIVADCLETPARHSYVWVEGGRVRRGDFGFHGPAGGARAESMPPPVPPLRGQAVRGEPATPAARAGADATAHGEPAADGRPAEAPDLEALVRRFLKLGPTADLREAGVDLTPGWDSLGHIELLLFLESALGISFSSEELDRTTRFADLQHLVRAKRTPSPHD